MKRKDIHILQGMNYLLCRRSTTKHVGLLTKPWELQDEQLLNPLLFSQNTLWLPLHSSH